MRRQRAAAFTLVELLVVIGIIALLMSILIPALSRAQQQAKQTACMSNLRQLGMIYQMYANDYKDQIPIGYSGGMGWTGYYVCDQNKVFSVMGAIYMAGMLKAPQGFYCPAQNDPRFMFDTDANPWPPAEKNLHTRVGYTSRPEVEWAGLKPKKPLPRMTQMRGKAILADIIGIPSSSPEYTNVHHKSLNVLYGDRAVRSVPRARYDPKQREIESKSPSGGAVAKEFYLVADDNPKPGLWNILDRAGAGIK